ncbi:MAG: glycosyltransferase family 2 protein [Candidatus Dormibacteria bacterium]
MTELANADARVLATKRDQLRQERDFEGADLIRAELEAGGWRVIDTAGGARLERLPRRPASSFGLDTFRRWQDVPTLPGSERTPGLTVVLAGSRWADDLRRCATSILDHSPGTRVLVSLSSDPDEEAALEWVEESLSQDGGEARVGGLVLEEFPGHAQRLDAGLRRARTDHVAIADTSVEFTGDALKPLLKALAGPGVGAAGPFGLRTRDLREFSDHPGPVVDALEGYLLVTRWAALEAAGGLHPKYRFYRNLDLDLSLSLRGLGLTLVSVGGLPLTRHAHRGWTETPEEERHRLSKRNFYTFIGRWGDRVDLLVDPGGVAGGSAGGEAGEDS